MKKYRVRLFSNRTENSSNPVMIDREIECKLIQIQGESILFLGDEDTVLNIFPCACTVVTIIE